ncbi:MAG TPA: hypothetical protein VFF13_03935 [archaeon]|nr:hypothetical protein [archaeon]
MVRRLFGGKGKKDPKKPHLTLISEPRLIPPEKPGRDLFGRKLDKKLGGIDG